MGSNVFFFVSDPLTGKYGLDHVLGVNHAVKMDCSAASTVGMWHL